MAQGGTRKGAGRPALSDEEKAQRQQERDMQKRQDLIEELIYPAICHSMHTHKKFFKDSLYHIQMRADEIRELYGEEGLSEWKDWFEMKKHGGFTQAGGVKQGYASEWALKQNKYFIVKKIVEGKGQTIDDLPNVNFPPPAMLKRGWLKMMKRNETAAKAAGPVAYNEWLKNGGNRPVQQIIDSIDTTGDASSYEMTTKAAAQKKLWLLDGAWGEAPNV